MKRSEVLKLIAGLYTVGIDFDPYTRADNLLCQLEEIGMLPPIEPGRTVYDLDLGVPEWENENE